MSCDFGSRIILRLGQKVDPPFIERVVDFEYHSREFHVRRIKVPERYWMNE